MVLLNRRSYSGLKMPICSGLHTGYNAIRIIFGIMLMLTLPMREIDCVNDPLQSAERIWTR